MHYIRHKCINTGEVYYTYIYIISFLIQTFITTLESVLSLDEMYCIMFLSQTCITTLCLCNILEYRHLIELVCSSAYEKARATIVTLHRLIDYVLPNVTAFQDGRKNFVLLKKIALRRISSAIGRWHHNCNSRDQFRYYTRDIGHTIARGK